jgi:dCMP deaminase
MSTGYNGNVSGTKHCFHDMDLGCETAMHAEANAIAFAARNGVGTEGADLYCTHEPCYHCSRLIINSGIKRVFFSEPYRKHDGVDLLLLVGIEVFRLNADYSVYSVRR